MSAVTLHEGDMRDVLQQLAADGVQFDSCVTDPPYHLTSIVKRFGGDKAAPAKHGTDGAFARASRGFMGKQWDGGDIAFRPETWRAVFDVLKPGAHLVAFGGTRTMHRIVCAIEDAGFEIRDGLMWLYGCGFPKSHDVAKGIDKAEGHWRGRAGDIASGNTAMSGGNYVRTDKGDPITANANAWAGWGTALKPAFEPIVLARKPLIGTVVANVLEHGTGALNIDASRIHGPDALGGAYTVKRLKPGATLEKTGGNWRPEEGGVEYHGEMKQGRWPANVLHDGSDEVLAAFPDAPGQQRFVGAKHGARPTVNCYGNYGPRPDTAPRGDSGSAARLFYSAKADKGDRAESGHPTVKPIDLMRWLVTLITPPGGTVLDPFAGSGSTGEAAMLGGFDATLIEREAEYAADIRHRIKRWSGEDAPLFSGVQRE